MKTMKRILALLLCLAFAAFPVPAHAAAASVLQIGTVGGRSGSVVTLEISLNEVNGICGGGFTVRYDNSRLTLLDAQAGDKLTDRICQINPRYAENALRVSFAGTSPIKAAGTMLRITFQISADALPGQIPVTAENVKLSDSDGKLVSTSFTPGSVTVQSVSAALSSDSCLPGEAVKLSMTLEGELLPCGGEFEIHYNERMLKAGSVKPENKLGNTGITLSYNIDEENARILVSWAAAEPVGELGQLCTVIFGVSESAAGQTTVSLENVKFFDETGRQMAQTAPVDGIVTVVEEYNEQPVVYVVGGQLADDGKTATIQIAVDGGGIVCGGHFTLEYDTTLCELQSLTRIKGCVATNPEEAAGASGRVLATWAEDSPALDNETILELTFALTGTRAAEITLDNVILKDRSGSTITDTQVHSGKIGISGDLQKPVAAVIHREKTIEVPVTLYDAQFCSKVQTESAAMILAAYSNGRMSSTVVPEESFSFDHNGIAKLSVEMPYNSKIDELQLFILSTDGSLVPISEKAELSISGN